MRVGPNLVLCVDAHELRRMWSARSPWTRSYWTHRGFRLDPARDNVLSMADDKAHTVLRSKLANGYNGREVEDLHARIDTQVVKLVGLIDKHYISTSSQLRSMKLSQVAHYFTLDVLSAIGFSEPFGYLDANEDLYDYIRTTEATLPVFIVTQLMPWALMILQSPLFKSLLPKNEDVVGLGKMMGIARRVVARRFGGDRHVRGDMLSSFIAHGLSKEEAESEILMQILAGSDTTASAIRATILFLMATPTAYAKLQAEVDDAVETGRASSPVITDSESRGLPYLQAVIKEGLRIFPPVSGPTFKFSPHDDVICGVRIPAGTNVGWTIWPLTHNTEVFGVDSAVFRPERWLEASPEKVREMEYWQLMVFASGGRWECLGKNIASIELNKVFFEVSVPLEKCLVVLMERCSPDSLSAAPPALQLFHRPSREAVQSVRRGGAPAEGVRRAGHASLGDHLSE